jgi:hypothetical protein
MLLLKGINKSVQKLLTDTAELGITRDEFIELKKRLVGLRGYLQEDWRNILQTCMSSGGGGKRMFQAKQAIELAQAIGPLIPFEKDDLTCMLYEYLLNPSAVDLLVATSDDPIHRENLVHRLCQEHREVRKVFADDVHSFYNPVRSCDLVMHEDEVTSALCRCN